MLKAFDAVSPRATEEIRSMARENTSNMAKRILDYQDELTIYNEVERATGESTWFFRDTVAEIVMRACMEEKR